MLLIVRILILSHPLLFSGISEINNQCQLSIIHQDQSFILDSKLIVACDGANSNIRKQLNIPTLQKEYQQTAVVFNVQLKRTHSGIAYERFHKYGVIAMLPLTKNRCGCIWTMPPGQAVEIKSKKK